MIKKIDHIVITTKDIEACLAFYEKIGFHTKRAMGRYELFAGDFKINVHLLEQELLPHAENVQPGSGDFCFELEERIEKFLKRLEAEGIVGETGIVLRHGRWGEMKSVYVRDPDGTLLEFSTYIL